jgi:hypothetical protein
MPHIVVPGSWHNVTRGRVRSELPAGNLAELLRAFVAEHPEAGYRLYSPTGELLRYHVFFVDGEQIGRDAATDTVPLDPESTVEVVPPLSGG